MLQPNGNFAVAVPYYTSWIKSVITDYDSDMDDLPDWWETLYGGDESSMMPGDNPDGDYASNYEEWLADTIPTDGNSYLHISAYTNAASLGFASSTNREYQVQYRTDLSDTNEMWQIEADWFAPAGIQTEVVLSTVSTNRFYRIRARRP